MDGDGKIDGRIDENRGRGDADVQYLVACRGVCVFGDGDAGYHADVTEESRDGDTLGDNQRQNGRGLGAQRFPDAEFMGAFLDGDEHDVAHSHNSAQQREKADNPDGGTQQIAGCLLLEVLFKAVPYPDGASVFGVKLLDGTYGAPVIFFKRLNTFHVGQAFGEEYQ